MQTADLIEDLNSIMDARENYALGKDDFSEDLLLREIASGIAWYLAEICEDADHEQLAETLENLDLDRSITTSAQIKAMELCKQIGKPTESDLQEMKDFAASGIENCLIELEKYRTPRSAIGDVLIEIGVKALLRRSPLAAAEAIDRSYTKLIARHIKPKQEPEL